MNLAAADWLHRRWYGGAAPGPLLRLASRVYRAGMTLRGAPVPVVMPVPVIVVGNFTVGGTGKTPLILALIDWLREQGYRPGVVSRGYGRRTRRPVQVGPETPARDAGDEPVLIHQRSGAPVFVDADRVAAAQRAAAAGCSIILSDDGLQHRRLARDIEIEVVDGERGYGNGRLLPAGPLRELPRPVPLRVINGAPAATGAWPMRLALGRPYSLADGRERDLPAFREAVAVAGIGHPQRFFDALAAAGALVEGHAFPDHHRFTAADFNGLRRPILMTEKDAVKCRRLDVPGLWAVPARAELPPAFFERLKLLLRERAR